MRALLIALVLLGACRTSSLPEGGGDGGAPADLAGGGSDGAARTCSLLCTMGFTCCNNACVNLRNDIHNCGACGVECAGPQPFCNGSACAPAPCTPACGKGELCCDVQGPGPSRGPSCTQPTDAGTCPRGCPLCL